MNPMRRVSSHGFRNRSGVGWAFGLRLSFFRRLAFACALFSSFFFFVIFHFYVFWMYLPITPPPSNRHCMYLYSTDTPVVDESVLDSKKNNRNHTFQLDTIVISSRPHVIPPSIDNPQRLLVLTCAHGHQRDPLPRHAHPPYVIQGHVAHPRREPIPGAFLDGYPPIRS